MTCTGLTPTWSCGRPGLDLIDAYWRAAQYLPVGQIYLPGNPLLRQLLRPGHVTPRLLMSWGTTPGLNQLHAHMNRVINERDLTARDATGPGHGGPGPVASGAYLQGTHGQACSSICPDEDTAAARPGTPALPIPDCGRQGRR